MLVVVFNILNDFVDVYSILTVVFVGLCLRSFYKSDQVSNCLYVLSL